MKYKVLGSSGVMVSQYCLGGMTFTRETGEEESHRILDAALDTGVNFIDTADNYEDGGSEEVIGRWMKGKPREKIFLATKLNPKNKRSGQFGNLSRSHMVQMCEVSLQRLQTDCIDLYLLHRPSDITPIDETLSALETLTQQGKIRYAGVSMFPAWEMADMVALAKARGWNPIVNVQSKFSLIERGLEDEVVPFCRAHGVGLTAYSPMAGGVLTGKYRGKKEIPEDTRAAAFSRFAKMLDDRTEAIVDTCEKIGADHGLGPHHVALAWTQTCPALSSAIVGARSAEQLLDTSKCFDFELTADETKRLNEVSERPAWTK